MKVKGIKVTFVFLILALVLMPFPIFAAEQTQIVPTWNWGSQYANQFTVTNFCEGSGTAVSCELRFTANNSYYGYLSFDGYNGTTKWIDYKNVWIADGYGAYRYSLYQNGVIQINKINIEGGFLKSSMDNLDLQDIIDLLTAIETDTTSIDNQINTELQRLQSIINNQIIQNGYMETLTKLRNYQIPWESYSFNYLLFANNFEVVDTNSYYYFTYPIFKLTPNSVLTQGTSTTNQKFYMIFGSSSYMNQSTFSQWFELNTMYSIDSWQSVTANNKFQFYKVSFVRSGSTGAFTLKYIGSSNLNFIAVYFNTASHINEVSTDFALQFGLSNQLLDDLHVIAQGTQQSNSAASELESSNSTMASDMNSMATIENGYTQDFNSQLQNIDFTNPIQQNQGILPAANFVISIFNGLISNNPFTVLIIIVCILLIGKKVIGK